MCGSNTIASKELTRAVSLVEILVAITILAALLLITTSIVNQTGKIWRSTTATTSAFRESRAAFESISRRLSQATLNPYFDYLDSAGQTRAQVGTSFTPDRYARQSELHFVSGPAASLLSGVAPTTAPRPGHALFFQAPLGFSDRAPTGDAQLVNLLNATGYFVQYGDDTPWRPDFLDAINVPIRQRYRLMQMVQGTEALRIYNEPLSAANRFNWFQNSLADSPALARPLAENVLMTVFTPLDPGGAGEELTSDYTYDSKGYLDGGPETFRNQLPPAVRVTMVVLDEVSAARLEELYPGGTATYLAPGEFFTSTADGQYQTDLDELGDELNGDRLNYRVFSTNVVIRQSKFSAD